MLAVVEEGGFFVFKVYAADKTSVQSDDLDELIKVHLDANDDCSVVALSSIFQMKTEIRTLNDEGRLVLFHEIQETHPVGKASLNPDADLVVVPLLNNKAAKVYKYDAC
jgi:hypothetical protein